MLKCLLRTANEAFRGVVWCGFVTCLVKANVAVTKKTKTNDRNRIESWWCSHVTNGMTQRRKVNRRRFHRTKSESYLLQTVASFSGMLLVASKTQ